MRKGIVKYIDPTLGQGYLMDENGQEISFTLQLPDDSIKVNTHVEFEIILQAYGLIACNIKPCEV